MDNNTSYEEIVKNIKLSHRNNLIKSFVQESNSIEGISKLSSNIILEKIGLFLELKEIHLKDLENLVNTIEPRAKLRNKEGMDVSVGGNPCEKGGESIEEQLKTILKNINTYSSYELYCEYEILHPFTDCNGRSGRILWLWLLNKRENRLIYSFLKEFHYQSIRHYRNTY